MNIINSNQISLKSKVKKIAAFYFENIKHIRNEIHSNPELSFEEFDTSSLIKSKLSEENIEFDTILETGVIAKIEGKNPKKRSIALRADIDALPIQEELNKNYSSKNENVMHACGHDVHTACMLGAAFILNKLNADFEGTIYLIFQPGEEVNPGGANLMIQNGILDIVKTNIFIAQHVSPELKIGQIGFCKGEAMASCDDFIIKIKGKGGHAGMPHLCIDPVVISSHIVIALQQLASRIINPLESVALTIGKIETVGGSNNIIPNEVILEGTLRLYDEKNRKFIHQEIDRIINGICSSMRGSYVFELEKGYPSLINDEFVTNKCINSAKKFIGNDNVIEIEKRMTSEDFSFFSRIGKACFFRIGTQSVNGENSSQLHTNKFDVDEGVFDLGTGLIAFIAIEYLS